MHSQTRRARSGPIGRLVVLAAAALGALALALAPAVGASAHDYLVDSTPKADSTQTTPLKQVDLTFNDVVLDLSHNGSSALLQVTGPDGASRHFETGCPKIDGRVVSVPVALGAPGKYVVSWQIVSADGHTVSDSIEFTYQPPEGTAAAKGTASRPDCGRSSEGSAASTSKPSKDASGAKADSNADSGSLGLVVTIAAIIIGLAVVGVIVVLVTGRRKSDDGTRDGGTERKPPRAPEDD